MNRIKNPVHIEDDDFDLQYIREHKPISPEIIDLKLQNAVNKERMTDILKKKDKHNYYDEYRQLKSSIERNEYKITVMEQKDDLLLKKAEIDMLLDYAKMNNEKEKPKPQPHKKISSDELKDLFRAKFRESFQPPEPIDDHLLQENTFRLNCVNKTVNKLQSSFQPPESDEDIEEDIEENPNMIKCIIDNELSKHIDLPTEKDFVNSLNQLRKNNKYCLYSDTSSDGDLEIPTLELDD